MMYRSKTMVILVNASARRFLKKHKRKIKNIPGELTHPIQKDNKKVKIEKLNIPSNYGIIIALDIRCKR